MKSTTNCPSHLPPLLANNNNSTASSEQSSQGYISNIRSFLNQAIASYSANDATKAKELATTAYLDNFEHIWSSQ